MAFQRDIMVVHTAGHPVTGVWTVMRSLMAFLKTQPGFLAAAGIFAKKSWPQPYREELVQLGIPHFLDKLPSFRWSYLMNLFSRALTERVQQLHDAFRPRHIILHFHDSFMSGAYLPVRPRLNCPLDIVASFHGVQDYQPTWHHTLSRPLHAALARRLRTCRAALTSVDLAGISKAVRYYGLNPAEFKYIPNGLERPGTRGCPRLRCPQLPLTVGYVGSLNPRKCWRLVVDAVHQLYRDGKNIKLIIAGTGADFNSASVSARQHPEFISFPGFVKNAGENLMPNLDVLVLPSEREGMPMVVLEALAAGVPVIGTPVGGIPELISHGLNGFLVAGEAKQIAACLDLLLNDRTLHRDMSVQAAKIFKEKFHFTRTAQAYLNLYQELASSTQ